MATIATISWNFVPGSMSTLVEYRVSGSETWITPASPDNPTLTNTYPLTIDENTFYDVRLTTNGIKCSPRSVTLQIIKSLECCPAGYTMSDDETYCFQTNTTAATPPSGSQNATDKSSIAYNSYGTVIFDPGFNVDGTGAFTQIPYANTFWVNGTGYPATTNNTTDGALNRAGVWAPSTSINQQIGFAVCVEAPEEGTYYVGVSCDDRATIRVDGNTVVQQDVAALAAFFAANGYPNAALVGIAPSMGYRFWYIYPITLTQGSHVVEMVGVNTTGTGPNDAALGCEIYNLTAAEIQAANTYLDMGADLLFSSKDYVGQPIQIGTGGVGYTCPAGYSLVLCDGPAYCTQTLIAEPIECTTTSTTTTTTTTL